MTKPSRPNTPSPDSHSDHPVIEEARALRIAIQKEKLVLPKGHIIYYAGRLMVGVRVGDNIYPVDRKFIVEDPYPPADEDGTMK